MAGPTISALLAALAAVLLCGSWANSKTCDWHTGQGVNYTESPWKWDLDKGCTHLELPIYLWGPMGPEGAIALADALKETTNIMRIDLDYNNIGDDGAEAIAAALEHLPIIAAVDLKGNAIGDNGAKAIATHLWHTQQLTQFYLDRNNVGPSGTRALAAALRKTPYIAFLSIGSNAIGDEGAKALASVLRHMPSLYGIDVSNNGIGEEGEKALSAAIARLEAWRGGEQFQHTMGISDEALEQARKTRPPPPPELYQVENPDLTHLPMHNFLRETCQMKQDVADIVQMLAALGVQELRDLKLWSNFELERNLKRSGVPHEMRSAMARCLEKHVRVETTAAPSPGNRDGEL